MALGFQCDAVPFCLHTAFYLCYDNSLFGQLVTRSRVLTISRWEDASYGTLAASVYGINPQMTVNFQMVDVLWRAKVNCKAREIWQPLFLSFLFLQVLALLVLGLNNLE